MIRSLSLVSVLFVLAAGISPAVAGFNEDQKLCNSSATPVDTGIAACTRQINSGRWKGHNLAISYYNRGIFWYDKGDNDKAIADYTRALGLSPDYASAYNNRGNAYSAKGDLDRALTDYDRAIQIDAKDPFRWNNRALIWKRKGNYDLAIADFDQAIRIDPGYTAAYTNRGEAYELKGDIERAKIDYNRALGTPQKFSNGKWAHDKARERLGALGSSPAPSRTTPPPPAPSRVATTFEQDQKLCNSSDTKIDEGIASCTRQITSGRWQGHDLAISYYNRGIFYYDKDDNDRAIADYTKALELSPNYTSAFNNRGNAYAAKGELDRAIADYDQAIKIDPKDPFRWNNRGLAWKRKGLFDRAIPDFDQAIKIDPGYTAAYTNRGETYEAKGDTERAKADYRAALAVPQKYSNGKYAHDKATERLRALGSSTTPTVVAQPAGTTFEQDQKLCNSSDTKLDDGIAACTRQIASGRWNGHNLAISFYNRGIFYYDKDELDKAISDYTRALELSPEYSSAYNNRGNAWSAKGDLERALTDYDAAIRIDGKDPFRWNNRGLILRRKGDHDRAIADFDQAIKIDPGYTAAYTNRGQTYEAKGDIVRARADYHAALALPQKYSNGKYAHDKASERIAALASSAVTTPPPPRPSGGVVTPPTPQAPMGKRVALVIGNGAYTAVGVLPNPIRDAEAITATLRRVGFTVIQETDLSKEKLDRALQRFAREADNADWALVYFAGHGIEVNGNNYLIPIDAKLEVDKDVDFEAVDLNKVISVVERAKRMRVVLLDACRDNPFKAKMRSTRVGATRSIKGGFAQVEPEAGTLVVYAAKHGETALDGDRGNSPFAMALMQNMVTPGLEIRKLFDLVRDDVLDMTNRKQQPFTYGSVPGRADFFFVPR
jgi:tetratricopeptide (TPR) repeat protein